MIDFKIFLFSLLITTVFCADTAEEEQDSVELYQWDGSSANLLTTDYSTVNLNGLTYFIVHGWTENATEVEYIQIAKNYKQLHPKANVFLVDYRFLAAESYLEARSIVNKAGTAMGDRIVTMIKGNIIKLNKIHMFGHSLGTHVCGKAAKIIKENMNNQRVPRISASDPAGPFFRLPLGLGIFDSLQESDADFLDITHTSYDMGTIEAFGTVDTYVELLHGNQPACDGQFTEDALLFCNHRMARDYFTESILSCGFLQRKRLLNITDAPTIIYGEHIPLNASGIYFLDVNAKSPYAQSDPKCVKPSCIKKYFK